MHPFRTILTLLAVTTTSLVAQQLGNHHLVLAGRDLEQKISTHGESVLYATVTPQSRVKLIVELCDESGRVLVRSESNQREHHLARFVPRGGRYVLRVRNAGDVPTLVHVEFGR